MPSGAQKRSELSETKSEGVGFGLPPSDPDSEVINPYIRLYPPHFVDDKK